MSRLWLMLFAVVAGAALALGATFTITSAVASHDESPSTQQLYNYGSR